MNETGLAAVQLRRAYLQSVRMRTLAERVAPTARIVGDLKNLWGKGWGYTRADTTSIIYDNENILRVLRQHELPLAGARRVENLYADTISEGATMLSDWLTSNATISGQRITPSTTGGFARPPSSQFTPAELGKTYLFAIDVTTSAANQNVRLRITTGAVTYDTDIVVAAAGTNRLVTDPAVLTDITDFYVYVFPDTSAGTNWVEVDRIMIQEVSGRADTSRPDSYVSKGVLSSPYQGYGVDGVEYFKTENGNTVASNVVTEATGIDIPVSDIYRSKLWNQCDYLNYLAMDATNRRASSWTNWTFNDIGGGTHTFSGTNNSTVTLDAPTPASSRAIAAISFDVTAGVSYVVSVEVVSCTTSGAATNTIQYLNGITAPTGDSTVNIPNGATGRYGYRFTANSTQAGLLVRFGCGAQGAVDAACNIVLTKPMIQEITDLTVPFANWLDLPVAVDSQGGYDFTSGNSGTVTSSTSRERLTAKEHNPFDFVIGIGDSFANDSTDWPQQLLHNAFAGVIHGKGYAGERLNTTILAAFDADTTQYAYGAVMLQGGVNDIAADQTAAQITTAVTTMIDTAYAAGKRMIILNVGPWKGYTGGTWSAARQTVTDDYNAQLLTLCNARGAIYVDIYALLEDPATPDTLLPAYDSGDHLHPNATGMVAIADLIATLLTDRYVKGKEQEAAYTNICDYSDDFNNAAWIKNDVTLTANNGYHINGVLDAYKAASTTVLTANMTRDVTIATTTNYNVSIFVENVDAVTTDFGLYDITAAGWLGEVTITWNGTEISGVANTAGTTTEIRFKKYRGNIWRVSFNTTSGANTAGRLYVYPGRTGSIGQGINAHGVQLTSGYGEHNLLVTNGAAASTVASAIQNTSISGAVFEDEGTIHIKIVVGPDGAETTGHKTICHFGTSNTNGLYLHGSTKRYAFYDGVTALLAPAGYPITYGNIDNIVVAYGFGTMEMYINGTLAATAAYSGSFLNSPTGIYLAAGDNWLHGVKLFEVYPEKLTDAECLLLAA